MCVIVETAEVSGLASPEYPPLSTSSAHSWNSGGRIAAMPWANGASSVGVIPSARATASAWVYPAIDVQKMSSSAMSYPAARLTSSPRWVWVPARASSTGRCSR